jgi:deoxyribonuclease (pyrimidine dimer)
MTRVNTVSPAVLTNEHLIVELRELSRIPNAIAEGRAIVRDIPLRYSMGEGHVKFFYDKLLFIKYRHDLLRAEYLKRTGKEYSFKLTLKDCPLHLCNNWTPDKADKLVNYERLKEKLFTRKRAYHYNGLTIDNDKSAQQMCDIILKSIK